MDSGKVSHWLQIAANLGLVVGLVLLAVQIHQASELTKHTMYFERWSAWLDQNLAIVGEEPSTLLAKADLTPEELSPSELLALNYYYGNRVLYWWRIKHLGERGVVDQEDWRASVDAGHPEFNTGLISELSTPSGRAYWALRRESYPDQEFVKAVDTAFEGMPMSTGDWYSSYHEAIVQHWRESEAQR